MFPKAPRLGIMQGAGYAVVALLLAATAALFYFGGFNSLLSNSSSSFTVALALTQSRAHRDARIVVLGNSAAAEDFHANRFNAHSQLVALNLGVPSGHLYLYDRLLSASRAEGVHPQTVVLIFTPEILSLRPDFDYLLNDLTLLKTVLNAADIVHLASHSRDLRAYVNYASYVAARPVLFRGELRDFFGHPAERLKEAAGIRAWFAGFGPRSPMIETDNSFSVCDAGPLPQLQQTIARLQREGRSAEAANVERVVPGYAARVHQPLRVDPFETVRFRRVLQQLKSHAAAVYLVPAPYYDPGFDQYPLAYRQAVDRAVADTAASVAGVKLLPPFPADCHLFFDTVHLNRTGADQFTDYLYTRVL